MIVRMVKVELIGAKDLLQDVLSLLRELGIFQIEPATVGFIEKGCEEHVRSFSPDEKTVFERVFYENLRARILELLSYLPKLELRKSYIEPFTVIDTIAKTVERHVLIAKELSEKRGRLGKERAELENYMIFLRSLSSLMESAKEAPDLDFIGLTIREPDMLGRLREAISRITDWKFELTTETASDGTLVGLITVEKVASDMVKRTLSDERVPELIFPASFSGLTFPEKIAYVEKRVSETGRETAMTDSALERLAVRWAPIYQCVREWLDDRLSVMSAAAFAFETRMCFFINGWMPAGDMERLRQRLSEGFQGRVELEKKDMREEDMDRVPIILRNPPYFRPFELFTRLLPLPAYTSYDPTPFIGIFFPVFFGMILGDAGYGLLLLIAAIVLIRRFRHRGDVRDGAKILLISSAYAVFFGVLYGEFFGDLPHRLFGLEPVCVERRTAVVPMLLFTLAVGLVHVTLGLILGALSALRKKAAREAAYKLLSIFIILGMIAALASFFGFLPGLLARPVIAAILILTPFLFFTGGLLAPLEFLKSIGNIISYVRIMAIGLTSVLLAFVANRLAGLTGDVVIGAVVGGLLHLLNIILGVFSPTIHSLRLHYVEFFSKFIEHGGRRFEPLKK